MDDATIVPKTERMKYTLDTCKLNRKELLEKRIVIKNDILPHINNYINEFFNDYQLEKFNKRVLELLSIEKDKAIPEREFTAWRKDICKNLIKLAMDELQKNT